MALKFGFYDNLNNDPDYYYNAEDISRIFDGIISDGVYEGYGKAFIVKASENDNEVIIQPGRAWLLHTWSYLDADEPIEAPQSEVVLDRIDALVLDIDTEPEVRKNRFLWVQGTLSSQDPQRPVLTSTETHKQYPLCYVYRAAGTTSITQANITNTVGTSELPFVTGIIDTINTDELLIQWEAQWEDFMANYVSDFSTWSAAQKTAFEAWFETIRGILDEDAAGHLQNEIDALQNEVDGVEELILPIGEATVANNTWTAMQVKNGNNIARLQMNAEGALRLFQSDDNGETWTQKEVGEKPTTRYNSETDMVQLYDGTQWVDWKKANLGWDGYFYNKGDYPADKFTSNWNHNMQASGSGATPSGSQAIQGQNFVLSVSTYVASADGSANGHEHILPIKLPELDAGKIVIKYYMTGNSGLARRLNFGIKSSSVASGENAMWMCAYGRDPWTNVIKQTGLINVGSDVTTLNTAEINISAGDTANDAYLAVAYGGLGSYSNSITIYIESIQYVANE